MREMTDIKSMEPYFCDKIPSDLAPGVLYISMTGRLAIHLCPCGCGETIVTPFAPGFWKLMFDGVSVSLWPSVGNYELGCKSHYFITNNRVLWCYRKDDYPKHKKSKAYKHGKRVHKKRRKN